LNVRKYMDCQTTISQISAYLDGELSSTDTAAVTSHLKQCESCSDLCNGQKLLDQSLRTGVLSAPIDSAALRDRIRQALPANRKSFFSFTPLRWVGLGIAAVAVAAFGLIAFQHFKKAPDTVSAANKALYVDLVDDYLDHGIPPGLNVGLDDARLKRQMARYQGVEKVMEHFRSQNYTLIHTQGCTLVNTNFLHLIYQKDGKYLSVFFKPVEAPLLTGRPTETVANVSVHEWTEQGMPLAALQGARCVVLLIGELPTSELHEVAGSTAPSLPVAMVIP